MNDLRLEVESFTIDPRPVFPVVPGPVSRNSGLVCGSGCKPFKVTIKMKDKWLDEGAKNKQTIDVGFLASETHCCDYAGRFTLGGEAPSKPDLTVKNLEHIPSEVKVGDNVTFRFTYSNIGKVTVPASPLYYFSFYLDGEFQTRASLEELKSGESKIEAFGPWKATAGTHKAIIDIDSTNVVDESDETNNAAYLTFTVPTSGAPSAPKNLSVEKQKSCDVTPPTYGAKFNWSASDGASGYYVDLAKTEADLKNGTGTFQHKPVSNPPATGQVSYLWQGLECGQDYYWRVWAYKGTDPNKNGIHGYPSPDHFSIDCCEEVPCNEFVETPVITSSNEVPNMCGPVWLKWRQPSGEINRNKPIKYRVKFVGPYTREYTWEFNRNDTTGDSKFYREHCEPGTDDDCEYNLELYGKYALPPPGGYTDSARWKAYVTLFSKPTGCNQATAESSTFHTRVASKYCPEQEPLPPAKVGCGGSCTTDSDCESGLTCPSGSCVNPSCPDKTDCVCCAELNEPCSSTVPCCNTAQYYCNSTTGRCEKKPGEGLTTDATVAKAYDFGMNDGEINTMDYGKLVSASGCWTPNFAPETDFDNNGRCDASDISAFFAAWDLQNELQIQSEVLPVAPQPTSTPAPAITPTPSPQEPTHWWDPRYWL